MFGVIFVSHSGPDWRPHTHAQVGILWVMALCAAGQEAHPNPKPTISPAVQASSAPGPELTSRDELTTFKVRVNVVLVRAVVRDAHGNAVGDLHQEDFELFDSGKPQTIRHFAMEGVGGKNAPQSIAVPAAGSATGSQPGASLVIPTHFVAYVFDDVHIDFGDLARLREAAKRHIDTLQPIDRAAIFTTSGQGNLDYTDDRPQLRNALDRLRPTRASRTTAAQCPDISYYMADLIRNKQDPTVLALATADALQCAFQDHNSTGRFSGPAEVMAQITAARVLTEGEHESRLALSVFQDVLRNMRVMPGRRTMLVLSPGFLTSGLEPEYVDLIEKALQSQVVGEYAQCPRPIYGEGRYLQGRAMKC